MQNSIKEIKYHVTMNIQKIEKIEEEVNELRKKKKDCQYLLKEVFYN